MDKVDFDPLIGLEGFVQLAEHPVTHIWLSPETLRVQESEKSHSFICNFAKVVKEMVLFNAR